MSAGRDVHASFGTFNDPIMVSATEIAMVETGPLYLDAFRIEHIVVNGGIVRQAQLRDEYIVSLRKPDSYIDQLKASRPKADFFTFVQEVDENIPKYTFIREWDSQAMLPLTTYEHWLTKQITFKPRNKIKKAHKIGVELMVVSFSDELVKAIIDVYNDSPIRQGKPNLHYGKSFDTVKHEHQTFLERSDFIGAFYKGEMIGFAKVTHCGGYSTLMNFVAKISHRDKAASNALLAKAVEICTGKGIRYLNYNFWNKGSLTDFKATNGFQQFKVPRYFVPLNVKGRLALKLKLHRKWTDVLPERCVRTGAALRGRWNAFRYRKLSAQNSVAD